MKDEGAADTRKENDETSASWTPTSPSLSNIYGMHEVPGAKEVNCLDVVSIGHQIQVHMMTLAFLAFKC